MSVVLECRLYTTHFVFPSLGYSNERNGIHKPFTAGLEFFFHTSVKKAIEPANSYYTGKYTQRMHSASGR